MLIQVNGFIKSISSRLFVFFKHTNRLLFTSISIILMVIVLGLLVYRQREIIINYQWQFRLMPILLSFLIFSLALFWVSIVWGWIMNRLSTKLSYHKHIRYYIVSNLTKRIPGTIWYVASRSQLYLSDGIDIRTTAVASGIEIVLITLAGILVVLLFSPQTLFAYHISPYIFVIIFILGLVLIHPKVIHWILLQRKIDTRTVNYGFIIQGIFAYFFSWILGGIVFFEIGNIIYPIAIENLPYFINCWTLVGIVSTILFFAPSNFGITEIGLSLLLSQIVPSPIAVLIAITTRLFMISFEIIWAGCFLWLMRPFKSAITRKD
jgi:glycosyltransferase 2 family protein